MKITVYNHLQTLVPFSLCLILLVVRFVRSLASASEDPKLIESMVEAGLAGLVVDCLGLHLFRKSIQIEGCRVLNNLAKSPANIVSF